MKSLRLPVGFLLLWLSLTATSASTIAQFRTTLGDFYVQLYDADKPVTVKNFLRYVQGGYYTNMFFHRVETNGIAVIQGGGFGIVNRGTTNAYVAYVRNFDPITNEFSIGKFYSNVYGTIAMAKTFDPNSATSQFFFNLADNSSALDSPGNAGGFTVFGRVVLGANILNRFLVGPTNTWLKELNMGGAFGQLPVLYSADPISPAFEDLIYADIRAFPAFTPLQTTYLGLIAPPSNVALGGPGLIALATTRGSKFTGSLRLGAARYAFSGSFDSDGNASVTATSKGREPLVLRLSPDTVLSADKLVGTISSGEWNTDVQVYRAGFDPRVRPATNYLGKYTLTLPPSGQTDAPAGYGFAALTVNAAGSVVVKGTLADGTAFSQTVPLSGDGRFPLYAPLYADAGCLAGWVALTNLPGAELSGSLLWYKPSGSKGLFPGGFTSTLTAAGGRYTAPAPGVNPLSSTYSCAFGGDSSTLSFTNTVILKTGNKLLNTSTNKLSITLTTASGLFSGSVKPPGSTRSLPFKGALWQNSGYGYFLNGSQSGWMLLQP